MVDPLEILRVIIRWLHALAAVAWVGGSFFYLAVLGPALEKSPPDGAVRAFLQVVSAQFGEVVDIAVAVLITTGVLLTVDRVGQGSTGSTYVGVLALKVGLSIWMFLLARELATSQRRRSLKRPPDPPPAQTGPRQWVSPRLLVLELGTIVFLLAIVLRAIYEAGLAAGPGVGL